MWKKGENTILQPPVLSERLIVQVSLDRGCLPVFFLLVMLPHPAEEEEEEVTRQRPARVSLFLYFILRSPSYTLINPGNDVVWWVW